MIFQEDNFSKYCLRIPIYESLVDIDSMTARIRAIVDDRGRSPPRSCTHGRPWATVDAAHDIAIGSTEPTSRKTSPCHLSDGEYRLMWYTDLLSSHRGTSENTPPHCCSAVLLTQPATFSLSRLSSLFPCLSPAFPFRFYFSLFLSRLLSLSASLSRAFVKLSREV